MAKRSWYIIDLVHILPFENHIFNVFFDIYEQGDNTCRSISRDMSYFVGITPFSNLLWVAMETMHFHIAHTILGHLRFAFLGYQWTIWHPWKIVLGCTQSYTWSRVDFFGCSIDDQRWRTLETGNREYTFICKLWHVYLHPADSHRR